MKRIPYGILNFEVLRKKNYLYVDKTSFIELLDRYAPYKLFIRPRRFGKSLFISMLETYYDINKKDKFEEIFRELYIGKNPTEEKNKFLIWKISFAGIDADNPLIVSDCESEECIKIDEEIYKTIQSNII